MEQEEKPNDALSSLEEIVWVGRHGAASSGAFSAFLVAVDAVVVAHDAELQSLRKENEALAQCLRRAGLCEEKGGFNRLHGGSRNLSSNSPSRDSCGEHSDSSGHTPLASAEHGGNFAVQAPAATEVQALGQEVSLRPAWAHEDIALASQHQHTGQFFMDIMSEKNLLETTERRYVARKSHVTETLQNAVEPLLQLPLHPYGTFRLVWNIMSILCIGWDMVYLPVDFAFELKELTIMLVLAILLAAFWTIDLFLNCVTGFWQGEHLEMRQREILVHYAKTNLLLDLAIVLCEWGSQLFATVLMSGAPVVRLPRTIRVLRAMRLIRVQKLQDAFDYLEETLSSEWLHLCFHLLKLVVALAVCVHIIACTWFAIGRLNSGWLGYYGNSLISVPATDTWKGFPFWYSASVRWTLAQINGRTDPDERRTTGEMVFTSFVSSLMAVVFMAVFISSITNVMLEASKLADERKTRMRALNRFLQSHRISEDLTARMRNHLSRLKDNQTLSCESERVLQELPAKIQQDVLVEARNGDVIAHPLFGYFHQNFSRLYRYIVHTGLVAAYTMKSEVVFDRGEACNRMFFMHSGALVYMKGTFVQKEEVVHESVREPSRKLVGVFKSKRLRRSEELQESYSDFSGVAHYLAANCWQLQNPNPQMFDSWWLKEAGFQAATAQGAVKKDTWVSEPALWVPWENRGRLVTISHTCILELEAHEFSRIVGEYKEANGIAMLYARCFVRELKASDLDTDLQHLPIFWKHEDDEP